MSPAEMTRRTRRLAAESGLARVGIAPATPVPRADYIRRWISEGKAGEMNYLLKYQDIRTDPAALLPGAKAVVVVADPYPANTAETIGQPPATAETDRPTASGGAAPPEGSPPVAGMGPLGRIARYAWGRDYHRVLRRKLHQLADAMHRVLPGPFETRVCVDTTPIVERELAAAAGLGWIGKNTMVIDAQAGSYFFLGEIVTTLPLLPDGPVADRCGTCTRCLEACPTGALIEPYRMDARRCIAYLTIEHRSSIPEELAARMADWLFGCDVCQEVCPYNRRPQPAVDPAYLPGPARPWPPAVPLAEVLACDDEQCRRRLQGSAMKRATPAMLRRNARIALENASRGGPVR